MQQPGKTEQGKRFAEAFEVRQHPHSLRNAVRAASVILRAVSVLVPGPVTKRDQAMIEDVDERTQASLGVVVEQLLGVVRW